MTILIELNNSLAAAARVKSPKSGRQKYIGSCTRCFSNETSRWYKKAILDNVLCKSCYDKNRREDVEYNKKRLLDRKQWSIDFPYKEAKKIAKAKGMEFYLTEDQYKEKTSNGCWYCGDALSTYGIKLDRLSNENYYANSNTVACCRRCNVAKNDRSFDDFIDWIKKISEKMGIT